MEDSKLVEILDDDSLLRRVPFTDPNYIKPDGTITSLAFSPRKQDKNQLSVDIEKLTTLKKSVLDRTKFRLYRLQVHIPRGLGLECSHDPRPDNSAHALVSGDFPKSICRKLATSALRVMEEY